MLGEAKLTAFVATRDGERARGFYEGVLGLRLLSDDGFGMEFEAGGTVLRVAKVEQLTPQPFTVVGFRVADVPTVVAALAARGVTMERFEAMDQDEQGIWRPPGSTGGVAWFKDLDGNLLSVSGE
jgi:catechol 2,3-dioxygenase-like lactoylglutathione lyase family enzyme